MATFQPRLIHGPPVFGFLFVCVSVPLFIWSFAWMVFLSTGLGLTHHCRLFTNSYLFSPALTQGEEQIMWVDYEITKAVVLYILSPHITVIEQIDFIVK